MENKDFEGMETDGAYNVVVLEKGIESLIPVYKHVNHHLQNTPFGIVEVHCGNLRRGTKDPVVVVTGSFRKSYSDLGTDPISGEKLPIYFVIGDIIVPAKPINEYQYQGSLLPNLPGGVNFFVSLNRMAPSSQVIKLKFPSKTTKSGCELKLEKKLANLLVTEEKDRQVLIRKLKKCDNLETHSEIILREYLKDWIFEGCRRVIATNKEGHAVIHLCASLGYAWAIGIFKRFAFSLNRKDETGWTPLHWAAYYGRRGAATSLLIGGADPTLVTPPTPDYLSGRTAADIASTRGYADLAAYLAETVKNPEKVLTLFAHHAKRGRVEG
ncbi:hypothetical protein MKW94_030778 [Papaver nudicaule]|uniref:Uncharacterized protein n=1 Tax=Papaver nudicaule TaxID=74823 RepID=A0AA41S3U1_PAPNU|nr:hypothetical protein [Papaver nudicaule]